MQAQPGRGQADGQQRPFRFLQQLLGLAQPQRIGRRRHWTCYVRRYGGSRDLPLQIRGQADVNGAGKFGHGDPERGIQGVPPILPG